MVRRFELYSFQALQLQLIVDIPYFRMMGRLHTMAIENAGLQSHKILGVISSQLHGVSVLNFSLLTPSRFDKY